MSARAYRHTTPLLFVSVPSGIIFFKLLFYSLVFKFLSTLGFSTLSRSLALVRSVMEEEDEEASVPVMNLPSISLQNSQFFSLSLSLLMCLHGFEFRTKTSTRTHTLTGGGREFPYFFIKIYG